MATLEELDAHVARLEERYENIAARPDASGAETQLDKLGMEFDNGFDRLDAAMRRFENRVVLKVGSIYTATAVALYLAQRFFG